MFEGLLVVVLVEVKRPDGDILAILSDRNGWTDCIFASPDISTVLVKGRLETKREDILDG